MRRFNTILSKNVPAFIALLLLALALGACDRSGRDQEAVDLDSEEVYFVEEYLRLLEARLYAAHGDSTAEGRFHFLERDLDSDSLRAIAQRLSTENPGRWPLIWEEIVRRKKIQEEEWR